MDLHATDAIATGEQPSPGPFQVVDRPRRETAPLRSSTVIFGHRDTAAGREPWVGRLTHDGDLAFAQLVLANGVLAEQLERERSDVAGGPGSRFTLDPEALAQRIVREGEGVFAFDTVFPQSGQPAIFHAEPSVLHFASPSHAPIVRLHVVDCDRLAMHVYGGGTRLFMGSSAFQLAYGPVLSTSGLDPRFERTSFAQAQEATNALLRADWSLNELSPTLLRIEKDARQIAMPTFEWNAAGALADRRNLKLCIANLAEPGTPMKGVVVSRGDFYVLQQDRASKRLWVHDRLEIEGRVLEIGDQLVVTYEAVPGPSMRAHPVRGRVRLVGPGPEIREAYSPPGAHPIRPAPSASLGAR